MLQPLFIGRFQPFHLGHLDVIRQILKQNGSVIIGIGSSQYESLPENPYSAALRKKMIEESLEEAGIAKNLYTIVEIPDIHHDDAWVAHVEKIAGKFGTVYSGTAKVQKLFQKNVKHSIITPNFNLQISGTEIRHNMAAGEPWKNLVPEAVAKILWK